MHRVIVGLDLAWAHTGYAVLTDAQPTSWGVIRTSPRQAAEQRACALADGLQRLLDSLRAQGGPKIVHDCFFFVEATDWHQRRPADRRRYARERRAQAALATARGVFYLWGHQQGVAYQEIGVRAWQAEFGSQRKDSIAEQLCVRWPTVFSMQWRGFKKRVVFAQSGQPAPTHVTDACAIAWVGWMRLRHG
jgi:hypothetical protein